MHPCFVSSFCSRLLSQVQSLWVSTFIFQTWDVRDDSNHRVSGLSICPRNFLRKKDTFWQQIFSTNQSSKSSNPKFAKRNTADFCFKLVQTCIDPPSGWLRIMPKTVRKAGMASPSRHAQLCSSLHVRSCMGISPQKFLMWQSISIKKNKLLTCWFLTVPQRNMVEGHGASSTTSTWLMIPPDVLHEPSINHQHQQ